MELNSYPDRLDLNHFNLRLAKRHGVKIVINTDAHHTSHMEKIRYGVLQAVVPGSLRMMSSNPSRSAVRQSHEACW